MNIPILSYQGKGDVSVSLDQLMVGGLLLQAGSGGGKTTATRQLLEETHGRVQHLVIDPEGEFGSLRERFDYVYAAPNGGDVVATPKTARLLCRRLVELGASAVLDIYDLKLHDKREFVRLFLEELMALPRSLWKPILVVVDEADAFFPQQGESSALEAGIDFNGRGRKRGYRGVFTTRRLSKLHKDVADVQNRMIGQTGLDLDVKRAGDELGMDKEARAQLPRLQPGSFFVYGPAISRTPILARSGPTVTTQPKPGAIGKVMPPAPAKVRALLAQLADLPKAAEEEAKTLEELRHENAGLKRQLRVAEKSGATREVVKEVADPRAVARAVAAAVKPHQLQIARLGMKLLPLVKALGDVTAKVEAVVLEARVQESGAETDGPVAHPGTRVSRNVAAAGVQPVPRRPVTSSPAGTPSIGKTPQRILNALRFLESVGGSPAARPAIAGLVGISADTGTFRNYLSELRSAGFIVDGASTTVGLTDAGREHASDEGLPRTTAELHSTWLSKVGGTPGRMLSVLLERYPEAVSREQVAQACGIDASTGTFRNYLSELRSPGLIVDVSRTEVRAADALFPEGLD